MTEKRRRAVIIGAWAMGALTLLNALLLIWFIFVGFQRDLDEVREEIFCIKKTRDEVLSAILAEKAEGITAGAQTDQEKCLRVARWIAANISNREEPGKDELRVFAYRAGLCRARADLFVRMLNYLHIPARQFNIYNFGKVGGGHSCAQAFYSGQWHFFDISYAGVFMREGKVLSWDEIIADPVSARQHMVVFERTLARYGWPGDEPADRPKVDNRIRMKRVYSFEALRTAGSYGFLGHPDLKTLYPRVDLDSITDVLEIGRPDNDFADVNREGVSLKISELLGSSLGTNVDTFHTSWEFFNCKPGREYGLSYQLYGASHAGLNFWAKGKNAEIISGPGFTSPKAGDWGGLRSWDIRFQCLKQGEPAVVTIGYDFREKGKYLLVDRIQIFPVRDSLKD
ncbi:MAG: transglutaminase-like domain-containing protein [Thermodesulfobacteriota bacterium]|nr:transglutaminase-like domain-containing protein [Thermodesulfobacteriota bacterium]